MNYKSLVVVVNVNFNSQIRQMGLKMTKVKGCACVPSQGQAAQFRFNHHSTNRKVIKVDNRNATEKSVKGTFKMCTCIGGFVVK